MAFRGTRSRSVPEVIPTDVTPELNTPGETSAQGAQTDQADLPPPSELGGILQAFQGVVQVVQLLAQNQVATQTQMQEVLALHRDQLMDPDRSRGALLLERFRRIKPAIFKGESSPCAAESWIREIEKIFRAIRCPEEDKVPLATSTLQDRADEGWISTLRRVFDEREDVSWKDFLAAFREKFFPDLVQEKLEREFLTLTQGSLSVMDYEARFFELEKFAPHICANERRRAAKFVRGLRGCFRSRIIGHDHQTLAAAVRAAYLLEDEQELCLEEKKASLGTRPTPVAGYVQKRRYEPSSPEPLPADQQGIAVINAVPLRAMHFICPQCRRRHGGAKCWKALGKCFNCGGSGHRSRNCPKQGSSAVVSRLGNDCRDVQVADRVFDGSCT